MNKRRGMEGAASPMATAKSFLFVPGNRPDRFAKAAESGADVVIIDLEDAVVPDEKEEARRNVVAWLDKHPAVVRINRVDSPWHGEDLRQLRGCAGPQAYMIPKAREADLKNLESPDSVPLLALVESAAGVLEAASIARLPAVSRLVFGNVDYSADVGLAGGYLGWDELLMARSALVLASAAAGLPGPVDGVHPLMDDLDGLRDTMARVSRLGMTGKLCIHPSQIEAVNEAFTPDPTHVEWARRVLEVRAQANNGLVVLDGEMLDKPQFDRAESILARSAGSGLAT